MRGRSNLLAPNSDELRDRWRLRPQMLQKHLHKNRCRGVRLNRASRVKYVHLRRAAHPTVPTLSSVDERPHRTWSEQVATKCACCQGPSSGLRARAAAVAGRLGSLDECSQQYRGGHDAPPRHTRVRGWQGPLGSSKVPPPPFDMAGCRRSQLALTDTRVQLAMSSGALACRPLTWWCSEVTRCRL